LASTPVADRVCTRNGCRGSPRWSSSRVASPSRLRQLDPSNGKSVDLQRLRYPTRPRVPQTADNVPGATIIVRASSADDTGCRRRVPGAASGRNSERLATSRTRPLCATETSVDIGVNDLQSCASSHAARTRSTAEVPQIAAESSQRGEPQRRAEAPQRCCIGALTKSSTRCLSAWDQWSWSASGQPWHKIKRLRQGRAQTFPQEELSRGAPSRPQMRPPWPG